MRLAVGKEGHMGDEGNHFAVLYVDSYEPSLRAFRLACQGQFRVLTCSTSREALERLEQYKNEVGVVVAAGCLCKRIGTEVLRRALECHPEVIRLLASDGCSLVEEEKSLRDGTAEGIVPIPWEPAELRKRLRAELERFAARKNDPSGGR
jgi:PleD family two-component response regulator